MENQNEESKKTMSALMDKLESFLLEKGKKETSSQRESEDGHGFSKDLEDYSVISGELTFKFTKERFTKWNPSCDTNGNRKLMYVYDFNQKKFVLSAERDCGRVIDRFSAGDELYQGSKTLDEKELWSIYRIDDGMVDKIEKLIND